MTAIDTKLEEWKRIEDAATPGPWYTVDLPWRPRDGATWVIAGSIDPHVGTPVCEPMEILEWEEGDEPTYTQQDADMAFIAMARNSFGGLIQVVEVLRAQLAGITKDKNHLAIALEMACRELNKTPDDFLNIVRQPIAAKEDDA